MTYNPEKTDRGTLYTLAQALENAYNFMNKQSLAPHIRDNAHKNAEKKRNLTAKQAQTLLERYEYANHGLGNYGADHMIEGEL